MNPDIEDATTTFEDECNKLGYQINLTVDEEDIKKYVLEQPEACQQIHEKMLERLKDKNVEMTVEPQEKSGAIFTFTQKTITDDHWKILPKNPNKEDLSIFVNPTDAKKVRNKQTIYQRIDQRMGEDQYKHPTGKHKRTQSSFRSSFGKSKTFGGLSEAIAGNSIPMKKEPDTNIALASANRSNSSGEKKEMRPYNKRIDATDLPTTIDDRFLELERVTHGSQIGRAGEERHGTTKKLVPDQTHEPNNIDGPEEVIGNSLTDRINRSADVIPDSSAAKDAADPTKALGIITRQQKMKPLGLFGPADLRQPNAGPVSNVSIQHPKDRSYDDTAPKIVVRKKPR